MIVAPLRLMIVLSIVNRRAHCFDIKDISVPTKPSVNVTVIPPIDTTTNVAVPPMSTATDTVFETDLRFLSTTDSPSSTTSPPSESTTVQPDFVPDVSEEVLPVVRTSIILDSLFPKTVDYPAFSISHEEFGFGEYDDGQHTVTSAEIQITPKDIVDGLFPPTDREFYYDDALDFDGFDNFDEIIGVVDTPNLLERTVTMPAWSIMVTIVASLLIAGIGMFVIWWKFRAISEELPRAYHYKVGGESLGEVLDQHGDKSTTDAPKADAEDSTVNSISENIDDYDE